jgi:hypothetical protein
MRFFAALLTLAALLQPALVRADVITFNSRPAWDASVALTPFAGGVFVEDFEDFAADTQFRTQTVDAGSFTLRLQGTGVLRNLIEVPPIPPLFTDNNGTKHASMYTDFETARVAMTFKTPIMAWGADFFEVAGTELVDLDLLTPAGALISTVPVTVNTGFFGFVTDPAEPIGQIVFRSRTSIPGALGEGFGLDNVTAASVPEPGGWVLAGVALICVVGHAICRWVTLHS